MRIYVGNLSYQVTDEDLKAIFGRYGQIDSVKVAIERFSGHSKGFGYIEMPKATEAEAAIAALNGVNVKGRAVIVSQSRLDTKRSQELEAKAHR